MTNISISNVRPWRVIVSRLAWSTACRRLLLEPGTWAVGHAVHHATVDARELLLDGMTVRRDLPQGSEYPPLADLLVVGVVRSRNELSGASLRRFSARMHPRASQLLAILLLDRHERRYWNGAVFHGDTVAELEEVRIVGAGMLRLTRGDGEPEDNGDGEHGRWSRTVGAVGRDVWKRLRQSSVTLVGAGRNGSQMAFQLAGIGVARLRIVDGDTLGEENLDAMPGLSATDVGQPKVEALGRRLREMCPDLNLVLRNSSATDVATTDFLRQRTDLIVTCVDNDTPRLAASLIASQTLTPHLDVGTSVQRDGTAGIAISGDVRLLLPGEGCVACVGGLRNLDEALYDLNAPPGSLRRSMSPAWHQQRAGSLITINSMTVGAAVQVWIDFVAARLTTSLWQRIAWIAGQGLSCEAAPVGPAEDCRFCRRHTLNTVRH